MARKLELIPGKFQWAPDKCEDLVLIDAFLKILPFVPGELYAFRQDFERQHFERGGAVGWHHLEQINAILRRKGLPTVNLVETQVSSYAKFSTPDRAAQRRAIRESLEMMPNDKREALIAAAREEMDNLPEPTQPIEIWKERKEANRRMLNPIAPVPPRILDSRPKLTVEQMAIMMSATEKSDLRQRIIAQATSEELIELIEMIDDPTARDLLIEARMSKIE